NRAQLVGESGGLVEEFVERNCVISREMVCDGAPKLKRLLQGGLIHRVLEQSGVKVADGVPVNIHVHAEFRTPIHGLVEQHKIALRRSGAPGDGMNWDADQMRSRPLNVDK